MTASDQRLRGCIGACATVERVLVDMGLGDALRQAEEEAKKALRTGTHMDSTESIAKTKFSAKVPPLQLDSLAPPMSLLLGRASARRLWQTKRAKAGHGQ